MGDVRVLESIHISDPATPSQQATVDSQGRLTVVGSLTHNSTAPDGNNLGVLPAVASANPSLLTEGDQVLFSVDLYGRLRLFDDLLKRSLGNIQEILLSVTQEHRRVWTLNRNRAVRHGTNPPSVSDGQRADAICNTHGVPYGIGGHPNVKSLRANYTSAQTNTVLVANSTGGGKIVVTRVMVTLDKATSVNVQAIVGFAQSITPTTTGVVASHPNIDPGGGFVAGDGSGILGIGNDGDQLLVNVAVPTGGSVDIVVSYYFVPI